MKVAVVGVCASGKSTLARGLRAAGYEAVDVAQEHSDVPYMWQAITKPDVLVYLDASDETVAQRSPQRGTVRFMPEQRARLAHARAHAAAIINVDGRDAAQVLDTALRVLSNPHHSKPEGHHES